jgi:hypothetical protein
MISNSQENFKCKRTKRMGLVPREVGLKRVNKKSKMILIQISGIFNKKLKKLIN